jgi:hypothetical protein
VSRAGEKLYGNWYGPEAERLQRMPWGELIHISALLIAIAVIGGSALFGFG